MLTEWPPRRDGSVKMRYSDTGAESDWINAAGLRPLAPLAAAAPAAAVAAGGPCAHPFAEQFVDYHHERAGGPWRCTACSGALADAATVAQWEAWQRDARGDDAAGCGGALDFGGALPIMRPAAAARRHAERLRGFGISVELLVAFTEIHGCWDWPTWRVQAEIIRPAC